MAYYPKDMQVTDLFCVGLKWLQMQFPAENKILKCCFVLFLVSHSFGVFVHVSK